MDKPVSVIIPAAGMGKRMRSFGPKGALKFGGESLTARAIRIIRGLLPEAEVLVVVGFEADRLRKAIPAKLKARLIYNHDYETTNVAHSLAVGLKAASHDDILVVYGDLFFGEKTISPLVDCVRSHQSAVLVEQEDVTLFGEDEVGVNVVEGKALYFTYGLPRKWLQIAYLAEPERKIFSSVVSEPRRANHYGFELLNEVLRLGGELQAVSPQDNDIKEYDHPKDVDKLESCARI